MKSLQSIERLRLFNKHWVQYEHPLGSILCYNTALSIKDYHDLLETDQVSFWFQFYFVLVLANFFILFCVGRLTTTDARVKGKELLTPAVLVTGEGTEVWLRYGNRMHVRSSIMVRMRAMVHASVI